MRRLSSTSATLADVFSSLGPMVSPSKETASPAVDPGPPSVSSAPGSVTGSRHGEKSGGKNSRRESLRRGESSSSGLGAFTLHIANLQVRRAGSLEDGGSTGKLAADRFHSNPSCGTVPSENCPKHSVKLNSLLELLRMLLEAHEVRYALHMLESMATSNLGQVDLCCHRQDFLQHLAPFADREFHRAAGHMTVGQFIHQLNSGVASNLQQQQGVMSPLAQSDGAGSLDSTLKPSPFGAHSAPQTPSVSVSTSSPTHPAKEAHDHHEEAPLLTTILSENVVAQAASSQSLEFESESEAESIGKSPRRRARTSSKQDEKDGREEELGERIDEAAELEDQLLSKLEETREWAPSSEEKEKMHTSLPLGELTSPGRSEESCSPVHSKSSPGNLLSVGAKNSNPLMVPNRSTASRASNAAACERARQQALLSMAAPAPPPEAAPAMEPAPTLLIQESALTTEVPGQVAEDQASVVQAVDSIPSAPRQTRFHRSRSTGSSAHFSQHTSLLQQPGAQQQQQQQLLPDTASLNPSSGPADFMDSLRPEAASNAFGMLRVPENDQHITIAGMTGPPQPVSKEDDLEDLSLEQIAWLATPSDPWVINPNSLPRVLWDFMALIFILFECVMVPLGLAFDIDIPTDMHTVSTTFFSMDVVLSLTTGFFHKSLLVMRRNWLTTRYLQTWCFLDIASTVPWDKLIEAVGKTSSDGAGRTTLLRVVKLGKLARVFRLMRLAKITTLVRRLQSSGLMPASMYQLKFGMAAARMFLVFGFLSHWMACIWGWIGEPSNWEDVEVSEPHDLSTCTMGGPCEPGIQGSPWRHRYGLDNFSSLTQYMAALQFTAALMTGGEPVMSPGRGIERVCAICIMISSVFISSAVVGEILLIMNRQSEINMQHDELVQQSRDFMTNRKVPASLQVRVYRYLEGKRQTETRNQASNRDFMNHLSGWLQVELVDCTNRLHVVKHPFFKELRGHTFLRRVCLEAAPEIYGAGDIVVEAGAPAHFMSFLVRGKFHIDRNAEGQGGVYLHPPSWIGDKCLFVETLRTNTVRSVTNSETLKIAKSIVVTGCYDFPEVKDHHAAFRSRILVNDLSLLRCPFCQDLGHCEEACPERQSLIQRRTTDNRASKRASVAIRRAATGWLGRQSER